MENEPVKSFCLQAYVCVFFSQHLCSDLHGSNSVVAFLSQEKNGNKCTKYFRNGNTPSNKDICKLGKLAQCQNPLKWRLSPIAQRKRKAAK